MPNKISADVKAMILGALEANGGQAWFQQQMDKNPVAFMALLGKILPHQVGGADDGPLVIRWESQLRDYTTEELLAVIAATEGTDR